MFSRRRSFSRETCGRASPAAAWMQGIPQREQREQQVGKGGQSPSLPSCPSLGTSAQPAFRSVLDEEGG
ncbi:MAG: hypothetical protein HFG32_08725 [Eubacterium sp.]|nr:hypothetical protein [Eubacterium sp.]